MKTTRRELEIAVATLPEGWEGNLEEMLALLPNQQPLDNEYEAEVKVMLDKRLAQYSGPNRPKGYTLEEVEAKLFGGDDN